MLPLTVTSVAEITLIPYRGGSMIVLLRMRMFVMPRLGADLLPTIFVRTMMAP